MVAGQDVEADPKVPGRVRIARRVAPGRVISTVDPEARHAHKTRSRRVDGYKAHIVAEPDTGIITAAELTAADTSDARVGARLLDSDPTAPHNTNTDTADTDTTGDTDSDPTAPHNTNTDTADTDTTGDTDSDPTAPHNTNTDTADTDTTGDTDSDPTAPHNTNTDTDTATAPDSAADDDERFVGLVLADSAYASGEDPRGVRGRGL